MVEKKREVGSEIDIQFYHFSFLKLFWAFIPFEIEDRKMDREENRVIVATYTRETA